MTARPEPNLLPPDLGAEEDAALREAEGKALRTLARLTESANERVALRAAEVLVRYANQRRREARIAAEPPRAKTDPKPPAAGETREPRRAIPHALIHPSRPPAAFRAVPPVTGGDTRPG